MKIKSHIVFFFVLFLIIQGKVYGVDNAAERSSELYVSKEESTVETNNGDILNKPIVINGTGSTTNITVTPLDISEGESISIMVSPGFSVSPTEILSGSSSTTVKVTLNSSDSKRGKLVLVCGDTREVIQLIGIGTPLEEKSLYASPIFKGQGDVDSFSADASQGFLPSPDKGYTIEFKVSGANGEGNEFSPYAVMSSGSGFKSLINFKNLRMHDSDVATYFVARLTQDNQAHVYRYAVTPDSRIFIYRDGLPVDTIRVVDYGLQSTFVSGIGSFQENLLKNPDFEGEHEEGFWDADLTMTTSIEGWVITPELDGWNSRQYVVSEQINNQVLEVARYKWSDGYSPAEISQIVDVVPNETYSFSVLAKGGVRDDGVLFGYLKIIDLQSGKEIKQDVLDDNYQTYKMDITTSSDCKQIKIIFGLEQDKWGSSISHLFVDKVKLSGKSRTYNNLVGFINKSSNVEYFTYDVTGAYAPENPSIKTSVKELTINGTKKIASFMVTPKLLSQPISIRVPAGFSVSPTEISSGASATMVKVTLNSSDSKKGELVLCSGDIKEVIPLTGIGTSLKEKSLSTSPIFNGQGDVESFSADASKGFSPSPSKGYTIEFKVATDNQEKEFYPYAVISSGVGFQSVISFNQMRMCDSDVTTCYITSLYNEDKAHTYRYAVTPDNRIFIYRDGLPVDTIRAIDCGLQNTFASGNGSFQKNLLKNPDFEGEHEEGVWDADLTMTTSIEGWVVTPELDGWNSRQYVVGDRINNQVLEVARYKWSDGYSPAEISQIVDVVANETYSFSALAKGGVRDDGALFGYLKIIDLQSGKEIKQDVLDNNYRTYKMSVTTSPNCKQIKVVLGLKQDKWGSSISNLFVDNVKFSGKSRTYNNLVGFINKSSNVEYFTYDVTGAYAPENPSINASEKELIIVGTNNTASFTVAPKYLLADQPISIVVPSGFSVSPAQIPSGASATTVTVTLKTTKSTTNGDLILRSGDTREIIQLRGIGTPLKEKSLSASPVYKRKKSAKSFSANASKGFSPTEKGYTVEFKVLTDKAGQEFCPYAVTSSGVGFKSQINSTGISMYNAEYIRGLMSLKNEDQAHTYRYAVTPDNRIYIYRDGLPIDTIRAIDYGLQNTFASGNGSFQKNLLKNSDFEGEHEEGDWWSNDPNMTTSIEGWTINPKDGWNSKQFIVQHEINNKLDHNNNVLEVQRYKWNDGWEPAEISQIVDVVPNETYSFTALAKGGVRNDGKLFGYLKIVDLQTGRELKEDVLGNDFKEYKMDFTTSSQTKQLRVVIGLERDKWGSSISNLLVDNVILSGKSRTYENVIGFTNKSSEIEYFTYDITGAYAPKNSSDSDEKSGDKESGRIRFKVTTEQKK